MAAAENYFVRHWRGKLSLAKSLLNIILIGTVILFAGSSILSVVWKTTASYVACYYIAAINFILVLLVEFWALVGTGRLVRNLWRCGKKAGPVLVLSLGLFLSYVRVSVGAIDLDFSHETYRWYNSGSRVLPPPDPRYFFELLFFERGPTHFAKPVIYLYPERAQKVSVKLRYQGALTTSYPTYDAAINGWAVTAYPDGHLVNHADNQVYSYLFWEGIPKRVNYDLSTGFVVAGKDTAAFLQKTLKAFGLTAREYNEFIVYWLPKMQDNPYNLIHFAGDKYTNTAPLDIDPKPDSMLRVFMLFKALQEPVEIPDQKIQPFQRTGFTVIEWGGTEVR